MEDEQTLVYETERQLWENLEPRNEKIKRSAVLLWSFSSFLGHLRWATHECAKETNNSTVHQAAVVLLCFARLAQHGMEPTTRLTGDLDGNVSFEY